MLSAWQKAIVTRIEQATFNTRRYWLQLPVAESFQFKPGQFVTLDLPVSEQRNKRWRSYSISSAPDGKNEFELIIVELEDGNGSKYMFNEVHVGSELTMRGPQGVFVLPGHIDTELFLICTGTGIAPFRSMLHHIHNQQTSHKNIHLIFGTRHQHDILYEAEMRELERSLEGFQFHVILSREPLNGQQGYVHQIYEKLCAERPEAKFMLCGWREMIDEARNRITAMGYSPKDIHIEIYG